MKPSSVEKVNLYLHSFYIINQGIKEAKNKRIKSFKKEKTKNKE